MIESPGVGDNGNYSVCRRLVHRKSIDRVVDATTRLTGNVRKCNLFLCCLRDHVAKGPTKRLLGVWVQGPPGPLNYGYIYMYLFTQ